MSHRVDSGPPQGRPWCSSSRLDTGREIGEVPGAEAALVANVVDREDALRAAENLPVPGVGRAQEQGRQGGVPVVAVHDVRREPDALTAFQRGTRQHQVAEIFIRSVGVRSVAGLKSGGQSIR